ncbi:MAG TPA: hypothetical protein VGM97_20090 [Steroidobacteraceae bacterium]|jgi:hypothetical protein
MAEVSARAALSEAIRYWEPRRIAYNFILFVEVAALYVAHLPTSRSNLDFNLVLALFVLAVLANVAYCAAYVVDVLSQLSTFRTSWLRVRWVLALIGITFAAALTYFFSLGFFG